MSSTPRIITVDPTDSIPSQIRAAFDLMDRLVRQVDVPSADEALEELQYAKCDAVIAAWNLGEQTQGWALAAQIKKTSPDTNVIILGDYDDTALDEDTRAQSPFVYLQRPYDIPQLIRVLQAALDGESIFEAAAQPATGGTVTRDMGPVPEINIEKATDIVQPLLRDLNALAILLTNREGHVVVEAGTMGLINREELSHVLATGMNTNFDLRDIIGSNASSLEFFDGDQHDIYVISVGFHYFMSIIFDGQHGSRALGAVSRFGRRGAEDLIGVLGANAWLIRRSEPKAKPEPVMRKSQMRATRPQAAQEEVTLATGSFGGDTDQVEAVADVPQEPVMPQLEAIPDDEFDLDAIFGADGGGDDFFSMDEMEELAKSDGGKGMVGYDQAIDLGILKS